MANYDWIIQQQAIRAAEGYLELAAGFAEQWQDDSELQMRLARRALEALEKLNHDARTQTHTLYIAGQAHRLLHQYQEAALELTTAAELNPETISIWLALAWCRKRTNQLDLAIKSLENALAIEPQEPILHYNLACYWSLAGNAKLALTYLAQAFHLDPTYRALVAEETDFDPIRELPDFQSLVRTAR